MSSKIAGVGWKRKNGRVGLQVLAAAITTVIIIISVAFAAAVVNHWGPFAPGTGADTEPILVQAMGVTSGGAASLSGAWAAVYSILPSSVANATSSPQGTSATHVLLWQGVTQSNGDVEGNLGAAFFSIAHAWTAVASPLTSTVSLLVLGTYIGFNATTNTTNVYTFSNYIQYSPWNPPSTFQTTLAFDLNQPISQIPGAVSVPFAGPQPAFGFECPPGTVTLTTNYDQDFTGPFPLEMVNNTDRTSSGYPQVVLAESLINSTVSFSFTGASASAEGSSGGVASMTSGASWSSSLENASVVQAGTSAGAETNYSFGMLYLNDVTINVLRQTENVTSYNSLDACKATTTTTHFLNVGIVGVGGSTFTLDGTAVSAVYGAAVTKLEQQQTGGQATAANDSIASGGSYLWSSMTAQASGYSTVASLEETVSNAVSTFDTALAVGLTIIDLADLCGVFCSAADALDTLSVISTALGFGHWLASELTSVSFSTTVIQSFDTITLTSIDGGFNDQVLEAPGTTTLETSSGSASAQMPTNVVAWAT